MSGNEIEKIRIMVKGYEESLPKLNILIFGPGELNPNEYAKKCFRKRREIKEFLKGKEHSAVLPEEAFEEAKRQGKDYPHIIPFEKYLVEQCCDVAIFLYVPNCPGVNYELSIFSTLPHCTRKIMFLYGNDCEYHPQWVFNDKVDLVKGGNGRVETFCQTDIEECHLREKIIKTIDSISRFLSMHPYKKYEGVR